MSSAVVEIRYAIGKELGGGDADGIEHYTDKNVMYIV